MRCDIAAREQLSPLSVEEVAVATGLSVAQIMGFAESGHLPYCCDMDGWDGQMAILDADLLHWLDAPEGTGAVADPTSARVRIGEFVRSLAA